MISVTAETYISCRVTSHRKALVRALAERRGVTASALINEVLEIMLQGAAPTQSPPPAPPEPVSRNARLNVRLRPEDWRLLKERAEARRMPSARYVSLLVRSHLRGVAPLPKTEYLALKQSVAELAVIGRNLNQIAHALNQGARAGLPGHPEVAAMLKVAAGLRDHFKGLLIANERSWTTS